MRGQLHSLDEVFCQNLRTRSELKAEGRELLLLLRVFLRSLYNIQARCSGKASNFSFGAGDSLLHWCILPIVAKVCFAKLPLTFEVVDLGTQALIDGVTDFKLDFAFVRADQTTALPKELLRVSIGSYRYRIYMPKGLLPKKKAIVRNEITKIPFAMIKILLKNSC